MTTSLRNTNSKNLISVVFVALLICFLFSCAKKTSAVGKSASSATTETSASTTLPENKGQVQIKRDANSNYVIQINLRELEEVNKLEPTSKKAYIVWMNAENQMTKSLGQINSNSGWLSDKSKASFEAVSEFKPTKVFITEEDNATTKKPGIKIIWATNRF